jgi:hypothetical protein
MSWNTIGATLGLPMATVQRLCDGETPGFKPVEIVGGAATGGLVVITPTGFRIEGLDAHGAVTLIRQLT